MKDIFPFVVRGPTDKLKRVEADTYAHALDKVLATNPNKFVTTQYAKRSAFDYKPKLRGIIGTAQPLKLKNKRFILITNTMDLQTARRDAATQSKAQKKKMYINIDGEGECIISSVPDKNPDLVMAAFVNGAEVALETEQAKTTATNTKLATKNKSPKSAATATTNNEMKTTKKATPAKKAVPAKKVAAKKSSAEKPALKTVTGEKKTLSITKILALVKAGNKVYRQSNPNNNGIMQENRMKKMVNKDLEIAVIIVKPAKA